MRSTAPLREMHVALVGMAGSGKSVTAIAVKYITKRFIGEYDSTLEDTYCRQDTVAGQPLMVWIMDTVDDATRDEMRWLAWADVYLVVYDVTSQLSLQYAESILERIATHEHLLCAREHKTILLGNKNDLERYRQVSEAEGEAMAAKYKIQFAESTAAGDPRPLSQLLHTTFQ
ncbi:GTP-binding domain protein, partial [Oesophagostomum dentatum]